jgi:hypothetical protein
MVVVLNNLKEIAESQQSSNINDTGIKTEIEKCKMAIEKIYNLKKGIYEDYKEGLLSKEEYLSYKTDYENSEKFHRDKIDVLEKQKKEDKDIFQNEWIIKLINTKKIGVLDRSILADFIDFVEIREDKSIKITWNCSTEINELLQSISAEL